MTVFAKPKIRRYGLTNDLLFLIYCFFKFLIQKAIWGYQSEILFCYICSKITIRKNNSMWLELSQGTQYTELLFGGNYTWPGVKSLNSGLGLAVWSWLIYFTSLGLIFLVDEVREVGQMMFQDLSSTGAQWPWNSRCRLHYLDCHQYIDEIQTLDMILVLSYFVQILAISQSSPLPVLYPGRPTFFFVRLNPRDLFFWFFH